MEQPATSPTPQIVPIEEDECWRLLPMAPLGRIGLTEGALPVVLPVHFTTRDGEVVVASLSDMKVRNADRGDVFVFQVDHYDPATGHGWAVNAIGHARKVTHPEEIRCLDELGFTPWSGCAGLCYIAIRPDVLRGRRLIGRAIDKS